VQDPAPARPYVGPRPFQPGEALFGRDREIAELGDRLAARRVVLLHAPSGAGKTSLIQAGLVPHMQAQGFWVPPVIGFRLAYMSGHILDTLLSKISHNRYYLNTLFSLMGTTSLLGTRIPAVNRMLRVLKIAVERFKETRQLPDPGNLVPLAVLLDSLHQDSKQVAVEEGGPPAQTAPHQAPYLVIFDSFEDLLRLDPTDRKTKQAFLSWLMPALYDPRQYFLFALREDYLAGLEPYLRFFPDRLSARYRLDFLRPEEALLAVTRPVEKYQVTYAAGVAERLVEDLRRVSVREAGQVRQALGEYVEPVLLQVVCSNLWDVPRLDPGLITQAELENLGKLDNALGDYYNRWVSRVAQEAQVEEGRLRKWLEEELVAGQGLRNQVLAGEEAAFGLNERAVQGLVNAWLLRQEARGERVFYELSHDRLVEPLRKANAAWRAEHVSPFREQAERWQAQNRPNSLVLLGATLHDAEAWAQAHPERLVPLEREFLQASRAEQAERRRLERAELGIDLERRGWGVIFPVDAYDPRIHEALLPLLEHRQKEAGPYYREFGVENGDGYRSGESARDFLARHGVGYDRVDASVMPFYLLIAGDDPEQIPFEFQYGLQMQFAVGRIQFETLREYRNYARSVVFSEREHEAGRFTLPNRLAVFAPQHRGDRATELSQRFLAQPLASRLQELQPAWQLEPVLVEQATKTRLGQLLGGELTPALFFNSSRAGFGILCQEWPGYGRITEEHMFTDRDIPDHARLLGLIPFLWGGETAGQPKYSNFLAPGEKPKQLIPRAQLSPFAQRLLSHPKGGALAVFGHVERAWGYSFTIELKGEHVGDIQVYEGILDRLMRGQTSGLAMTMITQRYSVLAGDYLEFILTEQQSERKLSANELQKRQYKAIDTRNYILLGDPAVRLPIQPGAPFIPPEGWQRPVLPRTRMPREWSQPLRKEPEVAEAEEEKLEGDSPAVTGPATF
jgi:hypothetical protein